MGSVLFISGLLIVALVLLHLALGIYTTALKVSRERERSQLSLRLLREQIKTSRRLRDLAMDAVASWNGYRQFVIDRKIEEADGICSFHLVPHDGKPLPEFTPGQFLTFRINIPEQDRPVIRCYSLSNSSGKNFYRVSIKRIPDNPVQTGSRPGLVSNFFHDQLKEKDIVDVKAPAGQFVLNAAKTRPAVLIGGGIGITPLLSMVDTIVESNSGQPIWLFYGVRNSHEHPWKEHLHTLAHEYDNVHIVVCYSSPKEDDVEGRDYDYCGRISVDLLKSYLETNNYPFYVCGPPGMMEEITKDLYDWGVPKKHIHTEAFGPESIKATLPKRSAAPAPSEITVTIARSGKKFKWNGAASNLLEFAEQNGAVIDAGCRAGNCGTCEIVVKRGKVDYTQDPRFPDLKEGCCLACIGIPKGDIELDV